MWRLVETQVVYIPFSGQIRPQPVVKLANVASGVEIWVMNVHNSPQGMEGERDRAEAVEIAKINELTADGTPMIVMGDFNEKQEILCTDHGADLARERHRGRQLLPAAAADARRLDLRLAVLHLRQLRGHPGRPGALHHRPRRPVQPAEPRMSAPVRLAALTMVRDERVMLPRWLAHYGRECGVDNLFVIDDNTTDGSTDGLPCSVIRIPSWGDKHFETTRMKLVSNIAAGLLEAYDAVLFADADEFLVADPKRHDGLRRPGRRSGPASTCSPRRRSTWSTTPRREGPLDPERPVLGQRQWAKFIPLMCKPAIKRVAAPWVAGSHGTTVPFEIEPDLYMFHLKFAEREHLRSTGDHRKALADTEGRAAETAWQFAGDDLVDLLDEVVRDVDPASVEPYKPRKKVLGGIIRQGDGGNYRAHGRRQFNAMRGQPMVQVPERFWGQV